MPTLAAHKPACRELTACAQKNIQSLQKPTLHASRARRSQEQAAGHSSSPASPTNRQISSKPSRATSSSAASCTATTPAAPLRESSRARCPRCRPATTSTRAPASRGTTVSTWSCAPARAASACTPAWTRRVGRGPPAKGGQSIHAAVTTDASLVLLLDDHLPILPRHACNTVKCTGHASASTCAEQQQGLTFRRVSITPRHSRAEARLGARRSAHCQHAHRMPGMQGSTSELARARHLAHVRHRLAGLRQQQRAAPRRRDVNHLRLAQVQPARVRCRV